MIKAIFSKLCVTIPILRDSIVFMIRYLFREVIPAFISVFPFGECLHREDC